MLNIVISFPVLPSPAEPRGLPRRLPLGPGLQRHLRRPSEPKRSPSPATRGRRRRKTVVSCNSNVVPLLYTKTEPAAAAALPLSPTATAAAAATAAATAKWLFELQDPVKRGIRV